MIKIVVLIKICQCAFKKPSRLSDGAACDQSLNITCCRCDVDEEEEEEDVADRLIKEQ